MTGQWTVDVLCPRSTSKHLSPESHKERADRLAKPDTERLPEDFQALQYVLRWVHSAVLITEHSNVGQNNPDEFIQGTLINMKTPHGL